MAGDDITEWWLGLPAWLSTYCHDVSRDCNAEVFAERLLADRRPYLTACVAELIRVGLDQVTVEERAEEFSHAVKELGAKVLLARVDMEITTAAITSESGRPINALTLGETWELMPDWLRKTLTDAGATPRRPLRLHNLLEKELELWSSC